MQQAGTLLDGRFEVVRELSRRKLLVRDREGSDQEHRILRLLSPEEDPYDADLRREVGATQAVSHPGIARIQAVGTFSDGRAYYLQDYVEGVDLYRWALGQPPEAVLQVFGQMFRILAAYHAEGLVPGGRRPFQFKVQEDGERTVLRLVDQGGLQEEFARGPVSAPRGVAPERAAGLPVDRRANLYEVGLILYELLAGSGELQISAPRHQPGSTPPPLTQLVPGLPLDLATFVMVLLRRLPDDRPPSVAQALSHLESLSGQRLGEGPLPVPRLPLPVPFVGRASELESLLGWAGFLGEQGTAAVSGTRALSRSAPIEEAPAPSLGIVGGEPGTGRRRLLDELALRLEPETLILRGRCGAGGQGPFGPFGDMLRHLVREPGVSVFHEVPEGARWVLRALLPDLARDLPTGLTPPPVEDTELRSLRQRDALAEHLLAIARDRPVAVLLSDLDRARPETLELVLHLARKTLAEREEASSATLILDDAPSPPQLLILATSESTQSEDFAGDPSVRTLVLDPLTTQDLEFLATAALGEARCPAALRDALDAHAQGNPALALQMVREQLAGELEVDPPGAEQVAYLDQLAASLLGSPQASRDAVLVLGLLGRAADGDLLAAVTGHETRELSAALERLCAQRVLERRTDGRVELAHPGLARRLAPRLPQESSRLLSQLPPALAERLGEITWHTRIEQAVELVELAGLASASETLKGHGGLAVAFLESLGAYARAANVCAAMCRATPDEASTWRRREAENRLHGGDPRRAAEILSKGIEGDEGESLDQWIAWIRALLAGGSDAEATIAIRRAHERFGDRADETLGRARLALLESGMHMAAGEREAATASIARGMEALKGLKGPETNQLRARLLRQDGLVALNGEEYKAATQLLKASLAIQEREGLEEDVAITLQRLGHAAFASGDLRRAEEHWTASLVRLGALGDRHGEAMVLSSLGLLEVRRGSLLTAREHLQRSLAIRSEIGDRRGRAAGLHNLGFVYACAGAMEEAEGAYRECLGLRLEEDDQWYAASAGNNLGDVLVHLGRMPEAYQLLSAALESRRALGDRRGEAESLASLGMIDLRRGDLALSVERVERAARIREELGAPDDVADALRRRARCLFSLGDLSGARKLAVRAVRVTEDDGVTVLEGPCRLLLGAIMARQGRVKMARRELERARRVSEQLGDRLTARTTTIELAALRLAAGHPAEARALLDSRPVPRPGRLRPLEGRLPPDRFGVLRVRERLLRARIELSLETGSVSTAARCAEEALAEARRAELRELEWRAVQALAATCELRGAHEQALSLTVEAQELVEALSERVPEAHRDAYLDADSLRAAALRGDSPVAVLGVLAVAPSEETAGMPLGKSDGLLHAMLESTVPTIQPARSGASSRTGKAKDSGGTTAISEGFQTLVRLNRLIVDEPNVARVQEALVHAAVEFCRAERGFLALFGDSHDDAKVLAAENMDDVEGPAQRFPRHCAFKAANTGQLVLSAEARVDNETKQRAHVVGLGLRSVIAAPVVSPDGRRGALYVDHAFHVGCFGAREVELFEALADLCAMSVGRGALETAIHHRQGVSPGLPQRQFLLAQGSLETPAPVTFGRPSGGLVGRSKSLRGVVDALERAALRPSSVLIEGPPGVGKGVAARALHDKSGRRKLTVCDLRELPRESLESELFGHTKGAFKGASGERKGLFVGADRGTLLLEHVDEVPLDVQAKLLRALEERTVRPLGGAEDLSFDVRVVATCGPGLAERVRDGSFREDLYLLLAQVHVVLEALDQRPEDKGPLIDAFLACMRGDPKPVLSAEARAALEHRRYPGDARELNAVLMAAASLAGDDPIHLDDLPPVRSRQPVTLREAMRVFEQQTVRRALTANRGDLTRTAKELGISRRALKRKMDQLDLS